MWTIQDSHDFLGFSFAFLIVLLVWFGINISHPKILLEKYAFKQVAPFYFAGCGMICLAAIGVVAFQANYIQLGLDQLMDASSKTLSVFVHLAIWTDILGTAIMGIGGALAECATLKIKIRIAWNILPILMVLSTPFL